MFQFSGFSSLTGLQVFNLQGCPIRTSMDLYSFAVPHSFSQLTTSFIVSKSLGIPRTLLFASYSYITLYTHLTTCIFVCNTNVLHTRIFNVSMKSSNQISPNLSTFFSSIFRIPLQLFFFFPWCQWTSLVSLLLIIPLLKLPNHFNRFTSILAVLPFIFIL